MDARLLTLFPQLARLEPAALDDLAARLQPVRLAAGAALFHPGGLCAGYPFLLAGRLVVRRIARSGREIVLYRVRPGQTCIMSTTCLMTEAQASAEAIAEEAVSALALPAAGFAHLLEVSAGFRGFALSACARRMGDLMARIEEMADSPIDRRLAARLLDAAGPDGVVRATHAALAADIGSAREVVTRAIGHFAAAGWLRPGRGAVALLDRRALRAVADGDDVTDAPAGTG